MHTSSAFYAAYVAVYRINPTHRTRLDKAKALGDGYELVRLAIPGLGAVFFDRASSTHIDDGLYPFDWYRDLVHTGARHHRFPDTYAAAIGAVSTRPDPDVARRCRNLALLHLVRFGRPRRR